MIKIYTHNYAITHLSFVEKRRLEILLLWSTGPNGTIKKIIIFQVIDPEEELYNLAFGDLLAGSDVINDIAVTNNGDTKLYSQLLEKQ